MRVPSLRRQVRSAAILLVCVAFMSATGGCAMLCPDRWVRTTMTLAPGQVAKGRFESPGGSRVLVQFWRQEPRTGVPPFEEATTWSGDGLVLIAFPDSTIPGENRLGYAHQWVEDSRVCNVVVRCAADQTTTFVWAVTGSADVSVTWDLGPDAGKQ